MAKLLKEFYLREDVVKISRELLGKVLYTRFNGQLTGGIIIETEAYAGVTDKASHAYNNRRTQRTEIMYREGGVAYVYLCYGMHALFNIVTNKKDIPHAILIRALKPFEGLDIMLKRRNKTKSDKMLTAGPGTITKALGIEVKHTDLSLLNDSIWIEDKGINVNTEKIKATTRIGIDYAGEDARLPYRFLIDVDEITNCELQITN